MMSSQTSTSASTRGSLLDPNVLQKIGRMELVAKQVMDGFVQGLHRSPHVGFALDFAQHRQYVPGDDIKRLDWRVYAKKRHAITSSICDLDEPAGDLVLDASASMAYRGKSDPLTKFRYAQFVAACLSYLVLHQQDSAGLATFDTKIRNFIPPRSTPAQLMRLLARWTRRSLLESLPLRRSCTRLPSAVTRRGMIIILSDFFDDGAPIEALHHLRYKRHEVILMQVMANDEIQFPFRNWSLFEDLERAGNRLKLDPALTRGVYLENLTNIRKP